MTSEICVMNRSAVVLAADSAITVTHGFGDDREERYFKGANKIFQLSDHHPVGMMVFDSAALLQVPWEIIVKSFRKQLDSKAFNSLSEYAEEFFKFLEGNAQLFPEVIRHNALHEAVVGAALDLLLAVKEHHANPDSQADATDDSISRAMEALEQRQYVGGLTSVDLENVIAVIGPRALDSLAKLIVDASLPSPSKPDDLLRIAVLDVLKDPNRYLTTTGLVFAGYGDHDVFPSMVEFSSSGMVLNRFVRQEEESASVDYNRPASIKAFAQTSMTDTFTLGFSRDVFMSLDRALNRGLRDFSHDILNKAGLADDSIPELDASIAGTVSTILDEWLGVAREDHSLPLRRVLAYLPIDELAELAETLIKLQSLKEKVTKPSETVGGPVDVAVITKHEGLVWIRRKYYFDAALNPRYLKRTGA